MIDWIKLAEQMSRIQADMIHQEHSDLCGAEFYAEALRRTFGFQPPHGHVKHETVNGSTGLTTVAYSDYLRDSHTIIDRLNREKAEKQIEEVRAEIQRVYLEARIDVAKAIRGRCNERSVPAKLRREGVLMAADWIDPAVPKDRYGNILSREDTAS